eukprot:g17286.t1
MLLPVTLLDGKIHIEQRGSQAVLETDFGLRVTYEWAWHLGIEVPSSYYGNLCGMCGNFNGNSQDEMVSPNGTVFTTVQEWSQAWKAYDDEALSYDSCIGYCPQCSSENRQLYQGPKYCGSLQTIFQSCHAKVDHTPFLESCIDDVCLYQGQSFMLCQVLAAYSTECQKQGIAITKWREKMDC